MISEYDDQQLLVTKLAIPRSYIKAVVPRVRLYSKLEIGARYPLLLISAPAGFGKTTLLSEWVSQREGRVAWLSLEGNDNQPRRFWRYLLAALGTVSVGSREQLDLCVEALHLMPIEDMLTWLINSVASSTGDILLVLDDYQLITAPEIHAGLEFLLAHLPLQMHICISTRSDPPLALARLRVRAQLVELRMEELRFTLEETADFLTNSMGLRLAAEEISVVSERTEGWIVALQFVASFLLGHADPAINAQFIRTFTGSHRTILSYLTEEIFGYLPEDVQNFLLCTAILGNMKPALCDAVTGQDQSESMFEWLEQANLFLITLDEQEKCYCYSPLFTDYLLYRLQQRPCLKIVELHLRASSWYEQQGMINEAVEHAFAAQNSERAADLIEGCGWSLVEAGWSSRVAGWLEVVHNTQLLAKRPWVAYLVAERYLHTGQVEYYQQAIQLAREACTAEQTEILCKIEALSAFGELFWGHSEQALTSVRRALSLADQQPLWSVQAQIFEGAVHMFSGDLMRADAALMQGQRTLQRYEQPLELLNLTVLSGDLQMWQGCLQGALESYQRATQEVGERLFWYRLVAHCHLSEVYYEWDQKGLAEEQLQQAGRLFEQVIPNYVASEWSLQAARLSWMNGDYKAAMNFLSKAEGEVERQGHHGSYLARITALRVHYALHSGEIAVAEHWLQCYELARNEVPTVLEREAWYQARARLAIVQGRVEESVILLEEILPLARRQRRVQSEITLLLLLVQAYHALGDARRTKQALEQALVLAEAGGYRRIFVDEGEGIATLLAELYHRQQKRFADEWQLRTLEYVRLLLVACGLDSEPRDWQMVHRRVQTPLGQLSEREHDVLKLIAAGNSNQQIAHALVVAESTIKTHLNNIYAKLNVNSRLQALTKAHSFGLLEQSGLSLREL